MPASVEVPAHSLRHAPVASDVSLAIFGKPQHDKLAAQASQRAALAKQERERANIGAEHTTELMRSLQRVNASKEQWDSKQKLQREERFQRNKVNQKALLAQARDTKDRAQKAIDLQAGHTELSRISNLYSPSSMHSRRKVSPAVCFPPVSLFSLGPPTFSAFAPRVDFIEQQKQAAIDKHNRTEAERNSLRQHRVCLLTK